MKLLFIILLSACLYCQLSAWSFTWSFSGGGLKNVGFSFPHDTTTRSGVRSLYEQHVVRAELVKRPFDGINLALGPISHSGVRVTLADGRQYLVHKGSNYGSSSQTVVVDASHMSDRWEVKDVVPVHGKTVSDFVKAGGDDFNLILDNCHDAAKRMIN